MDISTSYAPDDASPPPFFRPLPFSSMDSSFNPYVRRSMGLVIISVSVCLTALPQVWSVYAIRGNIYLSLTFLLSA